MKWIDANLETPVSGKFICLIADKLFFGTVINGCSVFYIDNDEILFNPDVSYNTDYGSFMQKGKGWIKPKHFAEVTHWMPLPEMPQ